MDVPSEGRIVDACIGMATAHDGQSRPTCRLTLKLAFDQVQAWVTQQVGNGASAATTRVTIEPHTDAASKRHGVLVRISPTNCQSSKARQLSEDYDGRRGGWLRVAFPTEDAPFIEGIGAFALAPVAAHLTATGALFVPYVEESLRRPPRRFTGRINAKPVNPDVARGKPYHGLTPPPPNDSKQADAQRADEARASATGNTEALDRAQFGEVKHTRPTETRTAPPSDQQIAQVVRVARAAGARYVLVNGARIYV
jgi:hypothetical protein